MNPFVWTNDPDVAKKEQTALRKLVATEHPDGEGWQFKKGLAIGTAYDENTRRAVAVALEFDPSGRYSRISRSADVEVDFPYVPGLLAFRVGPAICKLLDEQDDDYDLLLFDGQGIAHPRGIGLASHIGVLYGKPSIGVTRNRLFGEALEPPIQANAASPIYHPSSREIVGYSWVPGESTPAIFVSPGNLIDPKEALQLVRGITRPNSSFPTCLARAHGMANTARRQMLRKRDKQDNLGEHDD